MARQVVPARAPALHREAEAVRPKQPLLPKAPVLGWLSFVPGGGPMLPSVGDVHNRVYTTSGRAALLEALHQLALPAGSAVLVPTYHCPTMVAPVLQAGLVPEYFPIGRDGLPRLDGIPPAQAGRARVMFAAHYFGLPNSLQTVQAWCRERGIVLVEDCAHSYFGQAGDRPVGRWGDYATASLSKFFPVAEAGLLVSAERTLQPPSLAAPGARAQFKAALDVVELAHRHHRLGGIGHLLAPLFWLKNGTRPSGPAANGDAAPADAHAMMDGCDMGRVRQRASAAAVWLHHALPTVRIVRRRQANYAALAAGLAGAAGAHPLFERGVEQTAPYVFPLWVDGRDRADAVYARMRTERLPVFRWDRLWPGTPHDTDDAGVQWSRQVLQMLCHQDLSDADIAGVAEATQRILRAH